MNIFEKYNLCENEIYAFFASTSENVALVLYFKKIIEFKRTAKHCKYFCLFYEILMSNQRKESFFLYKKFKSKQKNPHFLNNPSP